MLPELGWSDFEEIWLTLSMFLLLLMYEEGLCKFSKKIAALAAQVANFLELTS